MVLLPQILQIKADFKVPILENSLNNGKYLGKFVLIRGKRKVSIRAKYMKNAGKVNQLLF